MKAYRPGQGLNREALDRLRARRQANDGISDLPAQDDSKQWDRLLGNGAKKKPRCSNCTKPIDEEDQSSKSFLCSNCTATLATSVAAIELSPAPHSSKQRPSEHSPAPCCSKQRPNEHSPAPHNSKQRSRTPSTHADSEDLDGSSTTPLNKEWDVQAKLEALKKGLDGEWVGDKGESYWIEARSQAVWTCTHHGKKTPIFYDKMSGTIWWGNRGSYFFDASELSACPDTITWCPNGLRSQFVWHRPHIATFSSGYHAPFSHDLRQTSDKHAHGPTQGWAEMDSVVANAIREVQEQLDMPDNQGFVWVNRWNERYLRHLGTLREFLESRPDEFAVIPLKGKAFRVAAASKAKHQRSRW